MKISIFTSNQLRHINLINSISKVAKTCYAIVEGKTIYPGKVDDFFYKSKIMEKYFSNVDKAEKKFFKNNKFINKSVKTKFIKHGDLNMIKTYYNNLQEWNINAGTYQYIYQKI